MAKKAKIVYAKRAFLNDNPEMSGFILAHLEEFGYHEGTKYPRVTGYPQLDIGDCSTKISLDFSFHSKREMKAARKKLELIKTVVTNLADAFDKEMKRLETHEKNLQKGKTKNAKST